jgi:hypothetical protein
LREPVARTFARSPKIDDDGGDEEKCGKLLKYAKQQYQLGKFELGIKYVRRVLTVCSTTMAASDAKALLEEWKKSEPFRIWKDASGKFSVLAKFVQIDVRSVQLQAKNGKSSAVEIERLSRADQEYVMNREGL